MKSWKVNKKKLKDSNVLMLGGRRRTKGMRESLDYSGSTFLLFITYFLYIHILEVMGVLKLMGIATLNLLEEKQTADNALMGVKTAGNTKYNPVEINFFFL